MAETAAVLVDRHDHVMVVTINRPKARNAVNLAVAEKRPPVWMAR